MDGAAVIYGPYTGSFTVTATLGDATAGLETITFLETVSAGETYTQSGAYESTASHTYTFDADDTFEGEATVAVSDRATNASRAHFRLARDATAPVVTLAAERDGGETHVAWSARDYVAGVDTDACTLEVRDGDGAWETLSTSCAGERACPSTGSGQVGEPGHAYAFRFTAVDNVGNETSAEAQASVPRVTKYYYHGGKRVAMRAAGVVYYLHGDHLGSTSLVTDEDGEEFSRQLYHPYGAVRYASGTLPTDFGFTGQRDVPGTGLMHYGARYYAPTWAASSAPIPSCPSRGSRRT